MVLSRSCGLSQVSVLLALLLGQSEETLRQRLREWSTIQPYKAEEAARMLKVHPVLRAIVVLDGMVAQSSRKWPWCWMRRPWDNASRCCACSVWMRAAPFRWPGSARHNQKELAAVLAGAQRSWME